MKTHISYLVIALLMINALSGQVKIGDNPQTLNPASVLELESTSRVLVITRVNDLQMNAINPLRGALVYNTDHDCLHYYNGAEWINICEALDNSFTVSTRADYLSQLFPSAKDSTVVITSTENPDGSLNYNFEVNVISRDNIGASAVTSSKIQNSSIENRHLAPQSISPLKFEDGLAEGDMFRWSLVWDEELGEMVMKWTLINEADINITEADGDPTNEYNTGIALNGTSIEITDDGSTLSQDLNGTFATDIELSDAITTSDAADLDKDETNELQDLNLTPGNILTVSNPATVGNQVDLTGYLDNTDDQDLSISGNLLSLSNDPTAGPIDLSVYLDNTDAQDLSIAGDILSLTGDPTATPIDLSGYTNDDTNELQDLSISGDLLNLSNDPTATPIDLSVYLDNTDAQDLSIAGDILSLTGDPTATPIDLSTYTNDDTNELQDLSISGDLLSLSNDPTATPIDLSVYMDNTDAQDLSIAADILSLTGDPTATPIDLSVYLDNTDAQDLSIAGDILSLTGDPTATPIDLSGYTNDDTNELQDLSLDLNNVLTLTNPATPTNEVNLSTLDETVTEGEGITVTNPPSTQEFNVAVTNPVIAMGKIISGALGANFGVNNFANNTGGSYEIILSTTPSDFIVQLTTSSNLGARTIQVTNQTANSFEVQVYEGASISDSDWYFTVIAF